jgi:hypothetical protein
MKRTLIAATLVAFPTIAAEFDTEAAKALCSAQWPTDFFMQKGCIDLQREGFEGLPGAVSGLPSEIGEGILQQCQAQWSNDLFMQKGCAELQAEAWHEVNG